MSLLDNPVWSALSTTQASFAEGDELAKRYPVDVAPFAATRDQSLESYHSLAKLLGPEETAALPLVREPDLPAGWTIVRKVNSAQMVWNRSALPPAKHVVEDLDISRVDEMLGLVELTAPGPFLRRTPELGSYLGIHEADQLVAMARGNDSDPIRRDHRCLHASRIPGPRMRKLTCLCAHPEDHKER